MQERMYYNSTSFDFIRIQSLGMNYVQVLHEMLKA